MSEIARKLVSTTFYYADGRVETIEHDDRLRAYPSEDCPKIVSGRTTRCYMDVTKIEDRTCMLSVTP